MMQTGRMIVAVKFPKAGQVPRLGASHSGSDAGTFPSRPPSASAHNKRHVILQQQSTIEATKLRPID